MTDKVLIVEDEQALRESLAYSPPREGYQVETAEDGQKGLELALRWTRGGLDKGESNDNQYPI